MCVVYRSYSVDFLHTPFDLSKFQVDACHAQGKGRTNLRAAMAAIGCCMSCWA